jgi:hypothetical protein
MVCIYDIRSPHSSPYMSSLMLWGFLRLLMDADPLALLKARITGTLEGYKIELDIPDCQSLEKEMNEKYKAYVSTGKGISEEPIRRRIEERRSQALEAWLGAYGMNAENFLSNHLPDEIDIALYKDKHECKYDLKRPHVTISASIGKWFYGSGKVASRNTILACAGCRGLAILGLEYNSLTLYIPREHATISVLGFEGTLTPEYALALASILNSSSPWIGELKNRLKGRIARNLPETLMSLYVSTFLPTDIPLGVNWYLITNTVSTGRTIAFGITHLNTIIDAVNDLRAAIPAFNKLVTGLYNLLGVDEYSSDAMEVLNRLDIYVKTRNSHYLYYFLRSLNTLTAKLRRESKYISSLSNINLENIVSLL